MVEVLVLFTGSCVGGFLLRLFYLFPCLVFKLCGTFDVLGWFFSLGVFVTLVYVFCGVLHLWFFFPLSLDFKF